MVTRSNLATDNSGGGLDFGVGILVALCGGALATPWFVHHFASGASAGNADIYSFFPIAGIAGLFVSTTLLKQNRRIQALEARLAESQRPQLD